MELEISKPGPKLGSPSTSSQKNAPHYSLFEIVLLVVVTALFYWFIVQPKQASLKVLNEGLNKLQQEDKSLSADLDKMNSLIRSLKNNPDKIAKLNEALPLDGKTPDVYLLITELARSSGVTVGDINVSGRSNDIVAGNQALIEHPFSAKRELQTLAVKVYVIGTYEQLKAFLQKLESNARVMDIVSLDMSATQNGLLALDLNLNTYFFGP